MSLIFERGHISSLTWVTLDVLIYLTFWLIRRIGTIRTVYSGFLILSFLILGEDLSPAKLGGLVLVVLGVILVET